MAVEIVKGNLFTYPCWVKVCTVNTVGAMGAGIAYGYRDRFPDGYWRYKKRCQKGLFKVTDLLVQKNGNEWWILFPTKMDWKADSKLEWIEHNLTRLTALCTEYKVSRIAIPWLGCRNGGLTRDEVLPLIERAFEGHSTLCLIVDR